MGLLDDAIREHLDLKRARGGDPAEIERLEREALGPVRREPTIGSTRFEAADEHATMAPGAGYPDDRDELLDPGYHDSTAPHLHPHEHGHDDPFELEPEQPKRRFLRRNRQAPLSDSDLPEPGFHEDPMLDPHDPLAHDDLLGHPGAVEHHDPLPPLEHHDPMQPLEQDEPVQPLEHHDPLEHHEAAEHHDPLEHHQAAEHHESLAHHELHEHDSGPEQAMPPATPPHLQFDHPPKRPRFSAEPPSLHPEQDEQPATPSPAPAPIEEDVVQETTEFDVQKHIAETRFRPDPETQVHPAPPSPPAPQVDPAPAPQPDPAPATQAHPAPAPPTQPPPAEEAVEDEDVLEETPEFLQDTPEHDRLWFEQRPPRDFDFDG
jgi:hypothetical protein